MFHDRICVIGKNGQGKTTLLRLLADELEPDSGRIRKHPDIKTGYFAQTNISTLNNSLSILDEISNAGCDKQKARNICGAMMFEDDMALKKIKARTLAVGIRSDQLFPPDEQERIATGVPGGQYVEIGSFYGHDGFLLEVEKITKVVSSFLNQH